jgi:pimeloyl-ACP methyl ester carboxylesterase
MITYPATINRVATRVMEAGSGPATMLLVHGLGARADRWRHNIDALASDGYRVVAVDLPGHGFASKGPDHDYSVPAFARFIEAVMDWAGASRATVVGTSLGGHTAAWFACEHPERVDALVLVASTGLIPLGAERRTQTQARVGDASREGVGRKLGIVVHDPKLVTQEWIDEESKINSSPGAAEGFRKLGEYFGERLDEDLVMPRLSPLVANDTLRLLLIWGADDVGFPVTMAEAAHRQLEKAPLVVLDRAAHAPYFERPEAFNRVLGDFLTGRLGEWSEPGVSYR